MRTIHFKSVKCTGRRDRIGTCLRCYKSNSYIIAYCIAKIIRIISFTCRDAKCIIAKYDLVLNEMTVRALPKLISIIAYQIMVSNGSIVVLIAVTTRRTCISSVTLCKTCGIGYYRITVIMSGSVNHSIWIAVATRGTCMSGITSFGTCRRSYFRLTVIVSGSVNLGICITVTARGTCMSGITLLGTCRRSYFRFAIVVSGSVNRFLCNEYLSTSVTVRTFGKTGFGTSRSNRLIYYLIMSKSINRISVLNSTTSRTSIGGESVLGTSRIGSNAGIIVSLCRNSRIYVTVATVQTNMFCITFFGTCRSSYYSLVVMSQCIRVRSATILTDRSLGTSSLAAAVTERINSAVYVST